MKHLAKLAQQHGFNTALFSHFVLVWDNAGAIAATKASSLKEWMGIKMSKLIPTQINQRMVNLATWKQRVLSNAIEFGFIETNQLTLAIGILAEVETEDALFLSIDSSAERTLSQALADASQV